MSDEALVVVDTMVVSALVNERLTVTEMRYGAMKANWGELRRHELERTLAKLVAVQPDDGLMTTCAELRDRCERNGVALGEKIHEVDRWIAATALHLGIDLVSDDRAFENIDGLRVLGRPPSTDESA